MYNMENVLKEKSYAFALRVVKLAQYLSSKKKEYVLSRQVLRSGTAIGALISEAEFAQSKPDFVNKLSVGLKEANETQYWLKLLNEGSYISETMYNGIQPQAKELIKLLVTSIKTAKDNIKADQ
jgi:four helix bundle protein